MAEYIERQVALDALGVTKNATKYGGDHSGYDTRMLYEIHDALTGIPAADVVSKADITALLEETEKELVKGTDDMPIARCFIVSIMGIVKCKIMQMGERKDE